jgi:hypothetical protein
MENENLLTKKDKENCEKANALYDQYQLEIIEAIKNIRSNNKADIITEKIRDKNKMFNAKMKELDITFLDDFFIKSIKKDWLPIKEFLTYLKETLK